MAVGRQLPAWHGHEGAVGPFDNLQVANDKAVIQSDRTESPQAIINVGGVTGLMPVTGLTLPFFSAGGSSLFVTLTTMGLLLNVARHVR